MKTSLSDEEIRSTAAPLDVSLAHFMKRFPEIQALPPAERPDFMFPKIFGSIRAEPMLADLLPIARD